MTLAAAQLPEGLVKQIRLAYEALHKRLAKSGDFRGSVNPANVHNGTPDFNELPDGYVNVWVNVRRVRLSEEESTFVMDGYRSSWEIFAVVRDDSQDDYGIDPFKGLETIGGIEHTLRETLGDIDLDGSVDVQEVTDIEHDTMRSQGGVKLDIWLLTVDALHNLINCRQ